MSGSASLASQRQPGARVEQEVEHHLRSVARAVGPAADERPDLARRHIGLAQQHRVAAQPLRLLPPGVHDRKVLRAGIDARLPPAR